MDLSTLKAHIQSKKFDKYYIFTGPEIGVMDIYINQIAKVTNKQIHRAEDFKEVFNSVTKQSMLKKSYVYVVRDDKEIISNEKAQSILKQAKWNDIVIFVFSSLDKRTKFFKAYKDTICEFEPLEERILIKYIKQQIDLSTENCQKLIQCCESDYSRIMLEIDKIKHYKWDADMVMNTYSNKYDIAFEDLLKAGVIYTPPRDAIFIWSDAVMQRRNPDNIFKLAQECYDSGEATLVMLSVLYRTLKQTLQVQSCQNKDVSKSTGLTGWQIKCVTPYVGKYKQSELLNAMKLIHEMELGIKTGKIDETLTVPYVLVNIL